MHTPSPDHLRIIVYVYASPFLVGDAEQSLRADILAMSAKNDFHLVETVVDLGPPKRRAAEYPALARVASGEADGVLVIRSLLYQRGRAADRLERLCPDGPSGWLSAEALEDAGMLPRQRRAMTPRRPSVKQRAAALRASGLNLAQIGQGLASEGYQRRGGLPWSAESVAKLLGISVLAGGLRGEGAEAEPPR